MSYINAPNTLVFHTFDLWWRIHSGFGTSERYLFYHIILMVCKTKRAGCLFQLNLLAVVDITELKSQKNSGTIASRKECTATIWMPSTNILPPEQKVKLKDLAP
jgi:hypothetical protein